MSPPDVVWAEPTADEAGWVFVAHATIEGALRYVRADEGDVVVGIEADERHCESAASRMTQEAMAL